MYIKQFYISLIFFLPFLGFSQQKRIQGFVKDISTNQAISGVTIGNGHKAVLSDESGYFSLNLDMTDSIVYFRMIGYQDTSIRWQSLDNIMLYLNETSYLLGTSVISSSRFEKPLAESSISIHVIKPELPQKLNSYSAKQVLSKVPGVQVIDGQANIRGGSGYSYGAGSRVLLMMDDLPVLQPDAGSANWDDLPLENVGQIEIVKGAASALYGSAAMNGIVHFRSNYPGSEPFTSASVSYTFFDDPGDNRAWWKKAGNLSPYETFISFVHRQKINSSDYVLSAQFYDRLGYNKDIDARTGRLNVLYRKRLSDRLKLSLGINFNKGKSSNFFYWKDEGLFEADSSAASHTDKLRFTIDPGLSYLSQAGYQHKFMSRYYYIRNDANNDQSNKSHNLYLEYHMAKNISGIDLQCLGGFVLNQSWTKAKLYSDTAFYYRNLAGFIQLEKTFFDRFILSAGARYERYDIEGPHSVGGTHLDAKVIQDTIIYRIGANYRLTKSSFIRASLGQGFRFPTIAEKFISTKAGGLDIVPNPDLTAEYGFSYEIGMKQAFRFKGIQMLADVAYFGSRYHDMMEFILNNKLQFQSKNIGDTDISGFEVELQSKAEFQNWQLSFGGGYSYIEPKYLEFDLTGKNLPINERENAPRAQQNAANSSSDINILKYRSRHQFKYDIQLDYKKAFLGLNFNYESHMEAIDWLFELSFFLKGVKEYRSKHNTGYRLYDFRAGYHFKHLSIQINVNNAFNENYTQRPGLMDAPRNFSLRLTYTY